MLQENIACLKFTGPCWAEVTAVHLGSLLHTESILATMYHKSIISLMQCASDDDCLP